MEKAKHGGDQLTLGNGHWNGVCAPTCLVAGGPSTRVVETGLNLLLVGGGNTSKPVSQSDCRPVSLVEGIHLNQYLNQCRPVCYTAVFDFRCAAVFVATSSAAFPTIITFYICINADRCTAKTSRDFSNLLVKKGKRIGPKLRPQPHNAVWSVPKRFRGEFLTMGH